MAWKACLLRSTFQFCRMSKLWCDGRHSTCSAQYICTSQFAKSVALRLCALSKEPKQRDRRALWEMLGMPVTLIVVMPAITGVCTCLTHQRCVCIKCVWFSAYQLYLNKTLTNAESHLQSFPGAPGMKPDTFHFNGFLVRTTEIYKKPCPARAASR